MGCAAAAILNQPTYTLTERFIIFLKKVSSWLWIFLLQLSDFVLIYPAFAKSMISFLDLILGEHFVNVLLDDHGIMARIVCYYAQGVKSSSCI